MTARYEGSDHLVVGFRIVGMALSEADKFYLCTEESTMSTHSTMYLSFCSGQGSNANVATLMQLRITYEPLS